MQERVEFQKYDKGRKLSAFSLDPYLLSICLCNIRMPLSCGPISLPFRNQID